jgi:hypothetical protein
MKHINHFNQFLIKESFADKEEIKELLEDYLLDYIDESLDSSHIQLDAYVSEDEIGGIETGTFYSSSYIGEGSLPIYAYALNLNKRYSASSIQKTINRIKSDKDFKVISYIANNSEILTGNATPTNGDIKESTKINIRFVYMVNQKASTPKEVKELSEPLKKSGYLLSSYRFGRYYNWTKSITKEVEMPLEWFSKIRHDGAYFLVVNKYNLAYDKVNKVFRDDTKKTFEELKSIIPQLPDLTRVGDNGYLYESKVGKLRLSVYCRPTRYSRDSDSMELQLNIEVSWAFSGFI